MATREKEKENPKKVNTLDEPQQKQIVAAIKKYNKAGYNQIKVDEDRKANGVWKQWQAKKQTEDNFDLEQYFTEDRDGEGAWNIGLIQGDYGDQEYGKFGIDADGRFKDVVEEALLALYDDELAERIRNTPQTKTPRGYHWLMEYKKRDYEDPLESEIIHKGREDGKAVHEEIKLIAKGGYMVEAPSITKHGSYIAIKDDFEKVAKLTKTEVNKLRYTIRQVIEEGQPEKEVNWTDQVNTVNVNEQMAKKYKRH